VWSELLVKTPNSAWPTKLVFMPQAVERSRRPVAIRIGLIDFAVVAQLASLPIFVMAKQRQEPGRES
jgi:hypothetical protein